LKQLFHIANTPSVSGQEILALRIGSNHISFCTGNKAATELYNLVYVSGDNKPVAGWTKEELAELISTYPFLKQSWYEVLVAFDYPQSILMPAAQYRLEEGNNLISSLYGKAAAAMTVAEAVPEWQLMNIYSVPREVKDWIAEYFPSARQLHQYSAGLKNLLAGEAAGTINLDIRRDDFTVMAGKNGKFLLAQTCEYSTPEDILYYLLKIVSVYSLAQQETKLQLSGLVDKQSALFKELYQYFIQLEFREAAWNNGEYPAHFFTSLNDLVRCAS
jgi:hypothetical protein